MKLVGLAILISVSSFGQITFEKGYYIDNNNKRSECLIKNADWKNNPVKFTYKSEGSDSIKVGSIESIKEFGINNYSKFIRADVKIDRSKVLMGSLSNDRNPIWSQEKLFLKVLVESKASLYKYTEGSLIRFFYSVAESPIEQLVFKEYMVKESVMNENNYFRQQLWLYVRCGNYNPDFQKISYNTRDLEKYFYNFNKCEGTPVEHRNVQTSSLNLRITPGINYSSLNISNPFIFPAKIVFNNSINYRLSTELEWVLPFNKNKWSVVFQPTLNTLNAEATGVARINYNSLEFPLGIRHYSFLNKTSKIFLNCLLIPQQATFNLNSSAIKFENPSYKPLDLSTGLSFALGLGYEYQRINVEMRYYSKTGLLGKYAFWDSDYRRVAFILGYKIFQRKEAPIKKI